MDFTRVVDSMITVAAVSPSPIADRRSPIVSAMPPRRLLALDLDGTVVDEHCLLPGAHRDALATIATMDVAIAIVTGRSLLTTRPVWKLLGLTTPLVCFNGAWVGLPGCNPIAQCVLEEDDVRLIFSELAGIDGAVCCYPTADRWLMDRELPLTRHWRELYQVPIDIIPDLRAMWRGSSCKMMFVARPELIAPTIARLRARLGERFHFVISQHDRFEIHRHGITKAWGLGKLANHPQFVALTVHRDAFGMIEKIGARI